MNNEELNKIIMKAENDYEAMKDRLHELYEENKTLKKNNEMLLEIINSIPKNVMNMIQSGEER